MWNNRYEALLEEWYNLRQKAATLPIEDSLHLIDDWWAKAPLINNYLHMDDYSSWPLPWDLLAEYSFCDVAVCLGKAYNLLLSRNDIESMYIGETNEIKYLEIITTVSTFILTNEAGVIHSTIDKDLIVRKVDCKFFKDKIA